MSSLTEHEFRPIGVHPIPLLPETIADYDNIAPEGMTAAERAREARQILSQVVVIELEVTGPAAAIDVSTLAQDERPNAQAPYDERFLDPQGENVIGMDAAEAHANHFRLAFFFHDYDASRPLRTPAGPLKLPPPTPMPARLRGLMSYTFP